VRLRAHQRGDVVLVDFNAGRLLERDGVGLMRRAVEHRRKAEELPWGWLVDDDVLLVFIDGRHADGA